MADAQPGQLTLFETAAPRHKTDTSTTFADNLALPIHRWFRYPAGFSADWVADVIERERRRGRTRVLDPFAGSGTVPLVAERAQVPSIGLEAHPFVAWVARAKLQWRERTTTFRSFARAVLTRARKGGGEASHYAPLIQRCFPGDALARLDALKKAWTALSDDSPSAELTWLAIGSILRESSPVGTAPWQYILPAKSKAKVADPLEAFEAKVHLMCRDMAHRQREPAGPPAAMLCEDARTCDPVADAWADLVVTSPPYANNYDYAYATLLEMSFWGDALTWADLKTAVRPRLVHSCTQHAAELGADSRALLDDPGLAPMRDEIASTWEQLARERGEHAGKKPYHTMITAYFVDMARVWSALRRVTAPGGLVCFVVGDSAPYGIHVPVETWLGQQAVAAGFPSFVFEKTRDRNVKWKNRKHRVPLHEGRLWVRG
jgi:DNA modification methylase